MLPDTTLVIPQHNHGELTRDLIQSVRRHESQCWPVIVVDDGSEDCSAALIEAAAFTDCRVIEQSHRGVTAAWNTGLAEVTTEFVVLINNDVRVGGAFLDFLIEALRNRPASIAGVEWRVEPLIRRRALAGWCLGFAVDLWRDLGGFDEALKWYFSDTDFQCRAANRGCELASVVGLPLEHLGHQTTRHDPRRRAMWQSDRAQFLHKWPEAAGPRPRGSSSTHRGGTAPLLQ